MCFKMITVESFGPLEKTSREPLNSLTPLRVKQHESFWQLSVSVHSLMEALGDEDALSHSLVVLA